MTSSSSTEPVLKASITSFIKSKSFTFNVGPDRVQYYVHVDALKAISVPLGYLMTNGKMEESIKGEASLPEVEPETFEQLVRFAYQGLCGSSENFVGDNVKAHPLIFQCRICNGLCDNEMTREKYPFCSDSCQAQHQKRLVQSRNIYKTYDAFCVFKECNTRFTLTAMASVLCVSHQNAENYAIYPEINAEKPKTHSGRFYLLQYGAAGLSHTGLRDLLHAHKATQASVLPVIHHAKLYVLASQYLIQDLRYISLHKLHRHLANFTITTDNVNELADLLTYTYSNTEDGGDIIQGNIDPLRHLVMVYIAEHSSDILKHDGFREVLGSGGAHTADFMALKFV